MHAEKIRTAVRRSLRKVFDMDHSPSNTDSLAFDLYAEPVDLKDLSRVLAEDHNLFLDENIMIGILDSQPEQLTLETLYRHLLHSNQGLAT